uniref:A-kinase-interacting protein 1-like n=1 Tax=Neolamprologus brichardi TaxID=32507 RepID=A0A3Q4HRM1_NEOBR
MMPLQKSLSSWHKPLVIAKLVTMSQSTSMWTSSYRPGRIKCGFLSLLQRFYKSGCCTQPSDIEKNHMSRFHTQPASAKTSAALPTRKCNKYQNRVSGSSEDFYIELSPGTYAITASVAESQQQTQLVSVKAGESVNLTFDL